VAKELKKKESAKQRNGFLLTEPRLPSQRGMWKSSKHRWGDSSRFLLTHSGSIAPPPRRCRALAPSPTTVLAPSPAPSLFLLHHRRAPPGRRQIPATSVISVAGEHTPEFPSVSYFVSPQQPSHSMFPTPATSNARSPAAMAEGLKGRSSFELLCFDPPETL
jgi:hypothetical protein